MRSALSLVLAALITGCAGSQAVTTTAEPSPTSQESVVVPSTQSEPVPGSLVNPDPEPVPEAEDRTESSITVGGMGASYETPNRAIVDLGVTSRRDSVVAASRAATDSGSALRSALLEMGVDESDIQTTQFSIQPYHDNWPEITGYEASLGYRVTLRDVDPIGEVLAEAIAAGGDDVRAWGMRFETDPKPLMESARDEAWRDAASRAADLTRLSGTSLGRVLDIHEKVLVTSSQGMSEGGEGDSAPFDIPVSPGVTGVVVLLTVTYAIGSAGPA